MRVDLPNEESGNPAIGSLWARTRIADLAASEAALGALREMRPDRAAGVIFRRPRALGRFFRQFGAALKHRLF